ncbi:MAG: hypothetical protein A2W28_07855 [Gammaproteobacteria bacterium RBG_16_51_14]|nr:MAG: hypothetical protein A2W28_07855 [Gammaproteobacteria bacterium RBG_16_51_14]
MHLNLKYLLLIRSIAIGGQVLALVFMQHYFSIKLPLVPVIIIISLLGLFTIISWHRFQNRRTISEKIFFTQLMMDVSALTTLIYFTGGSVNPFISLFILPITFAAASLRPVHTTVISLAAISGYTLLMFYHVPLGNDQSLHNNVQLHIWGMWYGFMLSGGLVAYFVSRIARTLRKQDQALTEAREEAMRAERILALGTLAAGTAHELGTPLSTMAVLAKELEHEYAGQDKLVHDLRLLRKQIDRCKSILSRMASDAGQTQADSGQRITVDEFLNGIIEDWRQLRPGVNVKFQWQGVGPAPEIIADQTLSHAIVNILNNAADASSRAIKIDGQWDATSLRIEIRDDGHGMSEKSRDKIGHAIFSTKPPDEGLGIGLFLAQTTLLRLGGSIRLDNHTEGGTHAEIQIPLAPISAYRSS